MFIELSETSADVQSESLDHVVRYRIVIEDDGPRRVETASSSLFSSVQHPLGSAVVDPNQACD